MNTPLEISGTATGFLIGFLTGFVSLIRRSRMFHPRGLLFDAKVTNTESIPFPDRCMVRLSSAWWKKKEWIDVLGISLRFETPNHEVQDLLFATISKPWLTPLGPFHTNFKNFFKNDYFAVSPFYFGDNKVFFKISPQLNDLKDSTRKEIVFDAIKKGTANFRLFMKDYRKEWIYVAEISLEKSLNLDQEALTFNPFHSGLGIRPAGFIHHLRIGAYAFSQKMRPKSLTNPGLPALDKGNASPS